MECAVLSSNIGVRGYANLLFHRGIYEGKYSQDSPELMAKRNACASIYLEGTSVFLGLPKYTKATIFHNDGSTSVIIMNDELVLQAIESVDDSFFLTDENWVRGVNRRWAGFLLPNNSKFLDEYKVGKLVKFANGESREITQVTPAGRYLNVYLNGESLDPEVVGLPTKFIVMDKPGRNPKESKK